MNALSRLPRLCSIKKVAQHCDVCTKTVERWISSRELPSYRLGGRVLVSEQDLLAYLQKHRQ